MSDSDDLKLKNQSLTHFPSNLPSHLIKVFLQNNRISHIPPEVARLTRLSVLWLAENQISILPDYLFTIVTLSKVNFASNQISEIPVNIQQLSGLKEIYFEHNLLVRIPASIQFLSDVQKLHLDDNKLIALPDEFGHMSSLVFLSLSKNELEKLPQSFCLLQKLQKLSLDHNKLSALPEEFGKLNKLHELFIQSNEITSLPISISSLKHLRVFNASSNQLAYLSAEIGELRNLKNFDLSDNKLQHLPDEFCQLSNLCELDIKKNQLAYLPDHWHRLKSLSILDLESNALISIPATIGNIPMLRVLNLNDNELSFLPPTLGCITSLQVLTVYNNPMKNILRPLDPSQVPSMSSSSLLSELRDLLPKMRESSHYADFRKILNVRAFADVKFVIGTTIVYAHQFILSARCPQFNLWFQLGRKGEPKMREITVTDDVTPEIFVKLIEFIYTGTIDELNEENAAILKKLSKQYQLDRLTRICRDTCEGETKSLKTSYAHERRTLLSQLRTAFIEEGFCDVCFIVEGRKINVHRIILQCRCEDLLALANTASSPVTTRRPSSANPALLPLQEVAVENIRYNIMTFLMEYLYCDSVKIEEMNQRDLLDLLAASHRFKVSRLKEIVEGAVIKFITEESVSDIFYASHLQQANQLSEFCLLFILGQYDTVIDKPSFQSLPPILKSLVKTKADQQARSLHS